VKRAVRVVPKKIDVGYQDQFHRIKDMIMLYMNTRKLCLNIRSLNINLSTV